MDTFISTWTFLFVGLLTLNAGLRFWLDSRQMQHVQTHRDHVPPPFQESVDLASHRKAADYTVAKLRLGTLEMVWGLTCLLGWTLLGGLHHLNQSLLELMGPGLWQNLALIACMGLIQSVADLPLSWWRTFKTETQFGFNRTAPSLWWSDLVKGWLMSGLLIGPLAAVVISIMDHSQGLWWLWAWLVWVLFSLLVMVIYPTWIAPLFNRFEPLNQDDLAHDVSSLMSRCGFQAKGFYVMDGSRRSAHANAYFTGLGRSKRVVFFDTLLSSLNRAEVMAVLAHELGHFKHGHIPKRMVKLFGVGLMALALLGYLAEQPWFYMGLGVSPNLEGSNSALALILFALTAPLVTLPLAPWMSRQSRTDEFQADAYASEHTSGADLANALVKLYKDNASTLTPDPLYVRFFYSHPPATERLQRLTAAAQ